MVSLPPPKHLRRKRDFKSYLKFMVAAVVIMIGLDYFLWGRERPYITKMKQDYYAEQAAKEAREKGAMEALLPPKIVYPETGEPYFEAPIEDIEEKVTEPEETNVIEEEGVVYEVIEEPVEQTQEEEKSSFVPIKPIIEGKPKIAIVIDDVGMNLKQSRAAIALDPNITLAFLPYAEQVKELSAQALENGNEIIIHAPMEAMNSDIDLGSLALKADMSLSDFNAEFQKISQSFEGYVGVNNHMGSRLTQDKQAMSQLMRLLKAKDLYFLDSKTISTSVAAEMAAFYGVPFAVRDVFLDHEDSTEFVTKALAKVEGVARRSGSAIAIGHPKANTMEGLQAWIATLEEKGFELVPLSKLIQKSAPTATIISSNSKISQEISQPASQSIEMTKEIKFRQPLKLDLSLPE